MVGRPFELVVKKESAARAHALRRRQIEPSLQSKILG
jgi:hypothetical protein